jgi:hypothetical protein
MDHRVKPGDDSECVAVSLPFRMCGLSSPSPRLRGEGRGEGRCLKERHYIPGVIAGLDPAIYPSSRPDKKKKAGLSPGLSN